MKKFVILIIFVCILFASCSAGSAKITEIKNRGELRVGVKVDVPRFGLLNDDTNLPEGMEIDIAKKLAESLLSDENAIVFIPVTALTRENLLKNNEVDLVIATYTITEERKENQNFSIPYYTDEIGFLVKSDSDIKSIKDAEGKIFGATLSSTANTQLDPSNNALGITYELKGFANYPEIQNSLSIGEIDVFAADKSILYGYVDEHTILLDEGYNPQDYGIATRLQDKDLTKHIDDFLKKMQEDGTLEEIINAWLK